MKKKHLIGISRRFFLCCIDQVTSSSSSSKKKKFFQATLKAIMNFIINFNVRPTKIKKRKKKVREKETCAAHSSKKKICYNKPTIEALNQGCYQHHDVIVCWYTYLLFSSSTRIVLTRCTHNTQRTESMWDGKKRNIKASTRDNATGELLQMLSGLPRDGDDEEEEAGQLLF